MTADAGPMKDRRNGEVRAPVVLAHSPAFRIGAVEVRPATREVIGPESREVIEPRIMQVLVALHDAGGEIVSREDLTHCCWEGRVVGDDAINRVISRIRKVAETVGGGAFKVETITKVGYRLVTGDGLAEAPRAAGVRPSPTLSRRALIGGGAAAAALSVAGAGWWWLGRGPAVSAEARATFDRAVDLFMNGEGEQATALFQRAADLAPGWAEPWGHLAMLLELSRINQEPRQADLVVARARAAADRALELDPRNGAALTARGLSLPVFGDWLNAETAFREALEADPAEIIARDYLSRVLDQVGRVREALSLVEPYRETFERMPGYQFRKAVMLWSIGRLGEAEQVIDAAMQRWPRVYTIWFSRYWLYVRTGRPQQALDMAARLPRPSNIPPWNFELNDLNARAILTRAPADIERAVRENRKASAQAAGFCENAIHLASQLGLLDEAYALADAYYFGRGFQVAASRFLIEDRTYTPNYRRLTAFLFTPSCAPFRADPRFRRLVEETGLAAYWRRTGTRADIMA